MNPSTQRAAPGIQAGRQRETNERRQKETQRAAPGIQAGKQREKSRETKGDK